jgi:hypothetical protein
MSALEGDPYRAIGRFADIGWSAEQVFSRCKRLSNRPK